MTIKNYGIRVKRLSNEEIQDMSTDGLKITEVKNNSLFEKAGIREGSILVRLNNVPINSPLELMVQLKAIRAENFTVQIQNPEGELEELNVQTFIPPKK